MSSMMPRSMRLIALVTHAVRSPQFAKESVTIVLSAAGVSKKAMNNIADDIAILSEVARLPSTPDKKHWQRVKVVDHQFREWCKELANARMRLATCDQTAIDVEMAQRFPCTIQPREETIPPDLSPALVARVRHLEIDLAAQPIVCDFALPMSTSPLLKAWLGAALGWDIQFEEHVKE